MTVARLAHVELEIAAPPARVWRALEPAGLGGWLCERADGALVAGQHLALAWPSLGLETELAVLAVEPPHRLVLGGTGLAAAERQETTLHAAPGGTRVEIRHGGFGDGARGRDRAAGSAAGWAVALRLLDLYLAGREGRALEAHAAIATAAAPVERLWAALADGEALAGWLGAIDGAPDREGARVTLTLGGRARDAVVLAREAPYELAFVVPSLDAVLRLRLIALGGPTLVCVQLCGWGGAAPIAPLAPALAAALDRLLAAHAGGAASA